MTPAPRPSSPIRRRSAAIAWLPIAAATLVWVAAGSATAEESGSDGDRGAYVEWDNGGHLFPPDIVKRFGRFQRNPQVWHRAEELAQKVLAKDALKSVHGLATWYLVRTNARRIPTGEATAEEVFAQLKKAVDLGFKNPMEIREAAELFPLEAIPEFVELREKMFVEYEAGRRRAFAAQVDKAFEQARKIETKGWDLSGIKPLDTATGRSFPAAGKPRLIVVSRIHHDGFNKLAPLLQDIHEKHGETLPMGVVFYQYDLDNGGRLAQSEEYVKGRGLGLPAAVMGRGTYQSLMEILRHHHEESHRLDGKKAAPPFNPFQPLSLFLDAAGKPLYWTRGVVEDWKFERLVERFLETIAAAASSAPPVKDNEPAEPEKPKEAEKEKASEDDAAASEKDEKEAGR